MAKKQIDSKLLLSLLSQVRLDITHLSDVLEVLNMFPHQRWFQLGLLLGILQPTLAKIEADHHNDVARCLQECMTCWLRRVDQVDERGRPTWDVLASTLKKMEENYVADKIIQTVNGKIKSAAQVLIYPIEIAQLLYSERCINKVALDEVERLEGSLENKMTTLLSAIHTAASFHHQNIKVFGTVLSKIEEMRSLGNEVLTLHAQKFLNEKETVLQEITTSDEMSPEDCAIDILRKYYGALSQSLHRATNVAQLLCEEKIISDEMLSHVKDSGLSQSEIKGILLKAIRDAVHINHRNLEVFTRILKSSSVNAQTGDDIFNDYVQTVKKDEVQTVAADFYISEGNNTSTSSSSSQNVKIPVPRSMSSEFTKIRAKFGIAFNNIRSIIKSNPPPLEDVKEFLEDCDSSLKPSLAHSKSISDILNVVRDKCTLVDINYLNAVVTRFNIEEAKPHIDSYEKVIEEFCRSVSVRLCLQEIFPVTFTPPSLNCETATFVLNWDPDDFMLNDITNLLSEVFERLHKWVTVKVIKEGNSVVVTCTFPPNLLGPLIAKAQETILSIKKKGLINFVIGHCIIWDMYKRDEKIQYLEEDMSKKDHLITELKSSLEEYISMDREQQDQSSTDTLSEKLKLLDRISKAKTSEIEKLIRQKEATDKILIDNKKEIETLQEKTTLLTLELKNREEKINQLIEKMKDLQSGIAEVSVWVKSTNPELSQRLDDLTITDKPSQESKLTSTSQDSSDTTQEEKTHSSIFRHDLLPASSTKDLPTQPYRMSKSNGHHGYALIINNINVSGRERRLGAEVDDINLAKTLETLGYKLFEDKCHRDYTAKEMTELFNKVTMETDHSQCDSFVCCLLSHGDVGKVYGSDDRPIILEDIKNSVIHCPSLVGKPKIFFITSARGGRLPETHIVDHEYADPILIPQDSDLFFGYSTSENTLSCRFTDIGSWYIIELCDALNKYHKELDLLSMVQIAQRQVAHKDEYIYERNERSKDGKSVTKSYKQSPQMVSTLVSPVYF